MFKVIQYKYIPTKKERRLLRLLCRISKNLYNSALYTLRQEYFKSKKVITYFELNKLLNSNENFHILNTYTSICIIRTVHNMFSNFVKGYTKMPKYLKQKDYFQLYTEQIRPIYKDKHLCIKLPLSNLTRSSKTFNKMFEDELINNFIKESEIRRCFDIYFKIPHIIKNKNIRVFRIVPSFKGLTYDIHIAYVDDTIFNIDKDPNQIMAIDLGVNNLATCVLSNNESFIIDGRYLKSINHFYNKHKAHLQSIKLNNKEYTLMEHKVTEKRNRRIKDALNKAARMLINIALQKRVSEIIIGYNKGFKSNGIKSNLPNKEKERINQNFIQIPISKFKQKIKELCNRYNIIYKEINESYTSVCSFYDNEEIKYHKTYVGQRITRSMFKTKTGKLINADINGALNILKKGKPERNDIITFLRNIGQTVPIRQKIQLR